VDWDLIKLYMNQELIDKVKEVQRTTDINFSPYYNELPKLINERGYKSGIELGLFAGGLSKRILDTTNIELMIGVDPYLEYAPDQIGMGTISTQEEFDIMCELAVSRLDPKRFEFLRMTTDRAFYTYLQTKYIAENAQYDFVFFDALHTAEQLTKDIANYVPLIRQGGVAAFHDWNHPTFPDLTPVINNFAASHGVDLVIGPLHFVHVIKTW
jgi:hypothetical protein